MLATACFAPAHIERFLSGSACKRVYREQLTVLKVIFIVMPLFALTSLAGTSYMSQGRVAPQAGVPYEYVALSSARHEQRST